jgi:hypothetical protein
VKVEKCAKEQSMTPLDKAVKKEQEVLVAVAEAIGAALGTTTAKAAEAGKVLLAAHAASRGTTKRTAKKLSKTLKSARKQAHKAARTARLVQRKSSANLSKALRRGRKMIRSRMR